MSSNGSNKRKAVHFAPEQRQPKKEKQTVVGDDDDDADAWDGEEDDQKSNIPSLGKVIDAKRQRRLKRLVKDEGDGDHDADDVKASASLDRDRSLAAEGIEVEPFNMEKEQTDGSGYFDGDTYVFRKRKDDDDDDGEPDAWLDSLSEKDIVMSSSSSYRKRQEAEEEKRPSMDDLSEQELYSKIVLLVSDSETVMQAIIRYGNLLKRHHKQHHNDKKGEAPPPASQLLAKQSLNDLTEAANALLLQGKVDIYQKTRKDLLQLLPTEQAHDASTSTTKNGEGQENNKQTVQWEYEGSQDGKIHGPYNTAEMLGWIRAGYFVGPGAAVRVRWIRTEEKEQTEQEELLADLLEDDNDEKPSGLETVRGEWMQSDEVDFTEYS